MVDGDGVSRGVVGRGTVAAEVEDGEGGVGLGWRVLFFELLGRGDDSGMGGGCNGAAVGFAGGDDGGGEVVREFNFGAAG